MWARQIPAWAHASDEAVNAFADGLVRLWERKQQAAPGPLHGRLLDAVRQWRAYRERIYSR
ncbi:hypothetical protein LUPAC06_05587 [Micromonospora saelicesensis]|nr:hypothetical protein LUPAC06_05587 [Micromonospora saelicesensis]